MLVAPAREVATWRAMVARLDTKQPVATRSYVPRSFAIAEVAPLIEQLAQARGPRGAGAQWRVVPNELTGTLVVTATPAEHEAIAALLEGLDAVPSATRRPVRTFPIRNRSVNEIVDVLTRLVEAGVLEAEAEPAGSGQHSSLTGWLTGWRLGIWSDRRRRLPSACLHVRGLVSVFSASAVWVGRSFCTAQPRTNQPRARALRSSPGSQGSKRVPRSYHQIPPTLQTHLGCSGKHQDRECRALQHWPSWLRAGQQPHRSTQPVDVVE